MMQRGNIIKGMMMAVVAIVTGVIWMEGVVRGIIMVRVIIQLVIEGVQVQ